MRSKNGTVLYDGECAMCSALVEHFGPILKRRGFALATLKAKNMPLHEMAILAQDGRVLGGADAIVYLSRFVWWAWPLSIISKLPGVMQVLRAAYRWIAFRRHRIRALF